MLRHHFGHHGHHRGALVRQDSFHGCLRNQGRAGTSSADSSCTCGTFAARDLFVAVFEEAADPSEAVVHHDATLGLIQMLEDLTHTYNRLNPASNVVAMIEQ